MSKPNLLSRLFGSNPRASAAVLDRDAAVRKALADHGDSGSTPRHTLFFFYGGDHQGLGAAAGRSGYQSRPTAEADGVILETTTAVDELSFADHGARMEAWAEEFGCDYDGWECAVVQN